MQKKKWVVLLLAVLLACSCTNDSNEPTTTISDESTSTISLSIPSQFHGTWESEEVNELTSENSTMIISSDDIYEYGISLVGLLQFVLDINQAQAESEGFDFTSEFTQSSASDDDYSFTLTMTESDGYASSSSVMKMSFALSNDGNSLTITTVEIVGDEAMPDEVTAYIRAS